jgi:hypothetical protein
MLGNGEMIFGMEQELTISTMGQPSMGIGTMINKLNDEINLY